MSKRITSGLVAGVAAICVAVPAVGLADKGGHPHSKKACTVHRHYGRHTGAQRGRKRGFDRGKKCGFSHTGTTGGTGSTGSTGATGATGPTGATGAH